MYDDDDACTLTTTTRIDISHFIRFPERRRRANGGAWSMRLHVCEFPANPLRTTRMQYKFLIAVCLCARPLLPLSRALHQYFVKLNRTITTAYDHYGQPHSTWTFNSYVYAALFIYKSRGFS